jgi:hypothetical protein
MTDITPQRMREIEAYLESQKQVNASKSAPTTNPNAPVTHSPATEERLPATTKEQPAVPENLTPEQATLVAKIRNSAWKEYLQEPRWCAWFQGDPKPDGDGFAKVPLGSHSDSKTWCTFDELCAKLKPGQGIGYNFLGGDLHPLDLDHVRNPQTEMICPEAMVLLSRLQTFSEVSISGRGLHVLFRGNVRGKQLGETCVQYWNPKNAPRFFTVTGDVVGEAFSTVRDIGDEFNYIFSTAAHISAKCREELATLDPEQHAKLPAEPVKKAAKPRAKSGDKRQRHPDFNMEEFLSWAGLPIDNITENTIGKLYRVTICPIKGEKHVGQNSTTTNFGLTADGGLMFHCQSTGCVEYHFSDVLKKLQEALGKYPGKMWAEKTIDYFSDGDLANNFVASEPALRFATDERIWFGYGNGVWQARDNAKPEIEAFLRSIEPNNITDPKAAASIHRRLTSTRACHAVSFFAEAKSQLAITVGQFDPNPMLLGLPDGEVLELRTGRSRAATPNDLITRSLPIAPKGRCERWLQYLEQAHPNDPELIAYLQRWAGYCLTASVKEDMILFLIGVGGSGCEKRTRSGAMKDNPLPMVKLNGNVRFIKSDINGWLVREAERTTA